jgi:hypothetical protein
MSYLLHHNAQSKQCEPDKRSTSKNYPPVQKQQEKVIEN